MEDRDKIAMSIEMLRISQEAFDEAMDEFNKTLEKELMFDKTTMKKYPKKKLNLSK